ncbi:MAG: hypothetical protein ORN51_04125, partial [Akkermansiaceae bacterium]|nr:hypothetical protein [Akkermansiaceae bacterium]
SKEEPSTQKDGSEKPGDEKQEAMSNERVEKREMSPEEAKQLLESLRQDERTVIPIPQPQRTRFATPDNSTKGKTW